MKTIKLTDKQAEDLVNVLLNSNNGCGCCSGDYSENETNAMLNTIASCGATYREFLWGNFEEEAIVEFLLEYVKDKGVDVLIDEIGKEYHRMMGPDGKGLNLVDPDSLVLRIHPEANKLFDSGDMLTAWGRPVKITEDRLNKGLFGWSWKVKRNR